MKGSSINQSVMKCPKFLHQRKQAKLQWLQDAGQIHAGIITL